MDAISTVSSVCDCMSLEVVVLVVFCVCVVNSVFFDSVGVSFVFGGLLDLSRVSVTCVEMFGMFLRSGLVILSEFLVDSIWSSSRVVVQSENTVFGNLSKILLGISSLASQTVCSEFVVVSGECVTLEWVVQCSYVVVCVL